MPVMAELWRRLIPLLAASVLLMSGSLPAMGQDQPGVFVGRIAGGESIDALIAVVVAPDGKVVAYACSRDNAWNEENSRWFTGQATFTDSEAFRTGRIAYDGALTATTRDGKQLRGQAAGNTLTGTVGGQPFTAQLVTGGTAGLYRGAVGDETHAVIEAADGTRVGGVWTPSTGRWAWTWNFTPTTPAERIDAAGLRVQRPVEAPPLAASSPAQAAVAQQFVFIELRNCVSSFDACG